MNFLKSKVVLDGVGPFDCFFQAEQPFLRGYRGPWFTKAVSEEVLNKCEHVKRWDLESYRTLHARRATPAFVAWDRGHCTDDEDNEGTAQAISPIGEWQGTFFTEPQADLFPIGRDAWQWVQVKEDSAAVAPAVKNLVSVSPV